MITTNHTISERVLSRKAELEVALAKCGPDGHLRENLEFALATVAPMLTGDLAHLGDVVSHDLCRWLERHKYDAMSSEPDSIGTFHTTLETDLDAASLDADPVAERLAADDGVAAVPDAQDDTTVTGNFERRHS